MVLKELFPDWEIIEKWISITLRRKTRIEILTACFHHVFDYKQ